MVEQIRLLRNVGLFDSITPGSQLPFERLTLIYAENGRGKTTLAAILRSLGTGNAKLIAERRRLGAQCDPHVIIAVGGSAHKFQNNAWSGSVRDISVFDDAFVAQNVCSGIEIEAGHRQNLHELILGAQGVALNATLQTHVAAIEEHNRQLRIKGDALPIAARGTLSADAFCALSNEPNLAASIQEAERNLAAARSTAAIQAEPTFVAPTLPTFDVELLNDLLGRDLQQLDAAAAARVQAHFSLLGRSGERWIGEGLALLDEMTPGPQSETCPFCVQNLTGSEIIAHYRTYFGEAYSALKEAIAAQIRSIETVHGGEHFAAFERNVRLATQRRSFWTQFVEVPPFEIDTVAIALAWKTARDAVLAALLAKQAAPLDPSKLDANALGAIANFIQIRAGFVGVADGILTVNADIALVKERSKTTTVDAINRDLSRLRIIEARYSPEMVTLCDAYIAEKVAKATTEAARAAARSALDNYRQNVFPAYETAINTYLQRFGAGFRLEGVSPVNNRGGSSATYAIVINNVTVDPDASSGPSFRNTLSAGDRNTLALAFFFASLDRDPQIAQKIVVIDDPMTSLDEHRSLTTVQEMRRLLNRVHQVIVLSHSKPFLWAIWDGTTNNSRTAMILGRSGTASTLATWSITQDAITEHDRRHARATAYLQQADPSVERVVASDLRPMLEAFVRVAYPEAFPAGSLLGRFIDICQQRHGTSRELLSSADTIELRDILDYANRFHHDTNAAWQTVIINDQELALFAQRTLRFARRG